MDRPAFALVWLLVFTIPWTNMVVFGAAGTVARILGAVTFGVCAVTTLGTRGLRPLNRIHIVMLVFVWWAALTFYWSLAPDRTLQQCGTYARLIAMVWVIWQFTTTVYRTRCLMQAFVLGAFVMIAGTFADRILAEQTTGVRFTAPGFNQNEVGVILALSIPIAWHLSTVHRPLGAWVNRLFVPLAAIAIFLTASRTGFVVLIFALLIIPWTIDALSRRARIAAIVAMGVLIFVTYSLVPSTSWERVGATPDAVAARDFAQRWEIWQAGLGVASEHAVVGVGTGAYGVAVEPVYGVEAVAHNAYVSVLVENGIIGLGLFCAIVLSLLVLVLRMPPAERKVWLVVVVAWMVGITTLTWEYSHTTWLLWGLLVANACAVDNPAPQTAALNLTALARESGLTVGRRVGCSCGGAVGHPQMK